METAKIKTGRCQNFRQLSLFTILTLLSAVTNAAEVNNVSIKRTPAAFEEEVLTVPLEQNRDSKSLFVEDDAGVMRSMRDSLSGWEQTEEYAKKWNLESTHLYKTPSTSNKSKFLAKNLVRYADKRLAGELKNAEEGTALYKAATVERSLRPNATVPITKYISFKFRARVLQGKAVMVVQNPWIECNAIVGANGKARVLTKKDFKQLGTSTGIEYNINESQFVAFVDQEITNNIKARISSTSQPNGNDADKKIEMNASFPFNL